MSRDVKYRVGKARLPYSNTYVVHVNDGYHHYFHKEINLTWHWWQFTSPAERIRRALDKAKKIADKLNSEELYLQHEADLVDRP